MKRIFTLILVCFVLSNGFAQDKEKKDNVKLGSIALDYSQPIHSLGFECKPAIAFAPKVEVEGPISPRPLNMFVPEFSFEYSCLFPSHWGFALEIPLGVYQKEAVFDFQKYGLENIDFIAGSFYIGFAPKLIYSDLLSEKCDIQAELGLKFMPFVHPASYWESQENIYPNQEMIGFSISQRSYLIPDATMSVLFLIRGKKRPQNNFVIGLCGNLSFVKRMSFEYDTFSTTLPLEDRSWGKCAWGSSSLGFVVGYRFMGLRP